MYLFSSLAHAQSRRSDPYAADCCPTCMSEGFGDLLIKKLEWKAKLNVLMFGKGFGVLLERPFHLLVGAGVVVAFSLRPVQSV
jgi:hypothetical protein